MAKFLKLIKNNKGATAIEYGLIAALIAVAAIAAMTEHRFEARLDLQQRFVEPALSSSRTVETERRRRKTPPFSCVPDC